MKSCAIKNWQITSGTMNLTHPSSWSCYTAWRQPQKGKDDDMSIMKEAKKRVRCAGRIALAGCSLLALTGCISDYVEDPAETSKHYEYRPDRREKSKGSLEPFLLPFLIFLL